MTRTGYDGRRVVLMPCSLQLVSHQDWCPCNWSPIKNNSKCTYDIKRGQHRSGDSVLEPLLCLTVAVTAAGARLAQTQHTGPHSCHACMDLRCAGGLQYAALSVLGPVNQRGRDATAVVDSHPQPHKLGTACRQRVSILCNTTQQTHAIATVKCQVWGSSQPNSGGGATAAVAETPNLAGGTAGTSKTVRNLSQSQMAL